jgi:hypothetical protein
MRSVLARTAILLAALTVTCLLLAGCGSQSTGAALVRAASTASATVSSGPAPGSVFGHALSDPAATVTGGQLYVTWQANPVSAPVPRYELVRADQATGAVGATRRLGAGYPGTPLAAGGWLWITTSTATGKQLLRMNPASLVVTGEISIGGRSYGGLTGSGADLAAAGGALWVTSGGRLLRVSLRTGTVIAVVPLPGADTAGVSASAGGTVLVVSEAREGLGAVQRRDPVTGTLIASHSMMGVVAARIGGVAGSGVWVAEPTGMMGYIERFGIATMTPDPATDVTGSNGIGVRVADGVAWVTEEVNPSHDYCADPVTGRVLGRISLPAPAVDYVTAISGRYVYYLAPAGPGSYLRRLGIPAGCRALSCSDRPRQIP